MYVTRKMAEKNNDYAEARVSIAFSSGSVVFLVFNIKNRHANVRQVGVIRTFSPMESHAKQVL